METFFPDPKKNLFSDHYEINLDKNSSYYEWKLSIQQIWHSSK